MAKPPDRPTMVYRAYDVDRILLYVGITWNPDDRLRAHRSTAEWVPYCADIAETWYSQRGPAQAAETKAVRIEHPVFNVIDSRCTCGGHCEVCASWAASPYAPAEHWGVPLRRLPEHECDRPYWAWKGRLIPAYLHGQRMARRDVSLRPGEDPGVWRTSSPTPCAPALCSSDAGLRLRQTKSPALPTPGQSRDRSHHPTP